MQFVYYVFLVLITAYVFFKTSQFVYFIPVFHVLMDMSFNFFPTLSVATFIRPIVVLLYLILVFRKIKNRKIYHPYYIFFIYAFILTAISSEFLYSLKGFLQALISMMMFAIGFEFINSPNKLKKLLISMIWVLVISLIATGLGYAFGIGKSFDYAKDEQSIGLLGSGGMYAGALGILMLPIIIPNIKKYWYKIALYFIGLSTYIFILLNVRRTAIIIPVIGYLSYLLYIPRKSKILISVLVAFFILLVLSPFYSDLLLQRFELRKEQGRFEENFYETEGRFIETKEVIAKTFSFNNLDNSLFGSKIFASGYSSGKKLDRMLHTDHAVLLAGSGIVGFLLYINIYISLLTKPNKGFLRFTRRKNYTYIALYLSLIVVSIFVSLNGSITQVTYRSILFLFLGALLSVDRSVLINEITNKIVATQNYNKI